MSNVKLEYISSLNEEYESFVRSQKTGHLFQSYYWRLVKNNWKWDAVILREDNGEIRATIGILTRKVPVLPYTIMYAPRGPVFKEGDYEALPLLAEGIKALAKKNKAYVLKTDPDISCEDERFISTMNSIGFKQLPEAEAFEQIQAQHVIRVDLRNKTEEEILNSFKSKTRYNIRLAMRHGVEVKRCPIEKIDEFYELMKTTGERDGFIIRPKEYLQRICESLGEHAALLIAYHEGTPLAGGIIGSYGPVSLYLYGASSNEKRNVMAPYLFQWEAIRFSIERGADFYDLRGVPKNAESDENVGGLYKFKSGFCQTTTHFCNASDFIFKPLIYNIIEKAFPMWRNLRKKLAGVKKHN